MIYLIYPKDPTTSFLDILLDNFSSSISEGKVQVLNCEASDDSYSVAKKNIQAIPDDSKIIFMGHGTPSILYGGASQTFVKKSLIKSSDMDTFKNKTLILMSCYSASLLKSSRRIRNYSDSIGFGLLPSDLSETTVKSNVEKLKLNESDIKNYQQCLVDIFSKLIDLLLNTTNTTEQIVNKLRLLINTNINTNILEADNTKLASLLYFTNVDIHYD